MRAIVHIAGRPDPDGIQRCIICQHHLAGQMQGVWPMGRDVAEVKAPPLDLHYELGTGPIEVVSIRCSAL